MLILKRQIRIDLGLWTALLVNHYAANSSNTWPSSDREQKILEITCIMYVAILLETIIATQIIADSYYKAHAWSIVGFY